MKIGRIVLIAIVVEALAITVLVALVAALGPSDPVEAEAYAQELGSWVGPLAGFVLCIAGGWLVASKLDARHVLAGLVLGALVAAIDAALLVAAGAEFQPIFAVSGVGKLVAGCMGGWLAGKGRGPATSG